MGGTVDGGIPLWPVCLRHGDIAMSDKLDKRARAAIRKRAKASRIMAKHDVGTYAKAHDWPTGKPSVQWGFTFGVKRHSKGMKIQ